MIVSREGSIGAVATVVVAVAVVVVVAVAGEIQKHLSGRVLEAQVTRQV